jgi:hypothetical protein
MSSNQGDTIPDLKPAHFSGRKFKSQMLSSKDLNDLQKSQSTKDLTSKV